MPRDALSIRLRPGQREALESAARKRRQRTGDKTDETTFARDAIADAVRSEGVDWPAKEEG